MTCARLSRRFLALLIIACSALMAFVVGAFADGCPPCDRDKPLPAAPGSNLNVCIDGSWDTAEGSGQTVPAIWNSTQAAVGSWNSARGSGGSTPPYTFSLNQGATCDIKIFDEPSPSRPSAPAATTSTRTPDGYFKMYLPAQTLAKVASVNDLKGIIAHELAHPLGIEHTAVGYNPRVGTCSSEFAGSIADGGHLYPSGQLKKPTQNPQARDVDAARRKAFNNSECSAIPADLKHQETPVSDVCFINPCADSACPDFDLEACTNFRIFRREDISDGNQCYERYEVTDHYWCDGGGCSYLGSSWRFLNVWCVASP